MTLHRIESGAASETVGALMTVLEPILSCGRWPGICMARLGCRRAIAAKAP